MLVPLTWRPRLVAYLSLLGNCRRNLSPESIEEATTMKAKRTASVPKATTARKRRKTDEVTDPTLGSEAEGSSAQVQSSQRIRKRGNVGKLSGLLDLPLDILFEVSQDESGSISSSLIAVDQIFGQLAPYDLLKLSRMTKEFRRVLMHKSSISVWKSALERIPGLPSCPEDMSEPQWVNLAFDPHCHVSTAWLLLIPVD